MPVAEKGPPGATHGDLIDFLEQRIPLFLSEEWDNCGLQAGSRKTPLAGVACALEPTLETLAEAAGRGANFIFTHHPLLFRPLPCFDFDAFPGSLLVQAATRRVTIYSAHTNLDKVSGGVNDDLARRLGLSVCRPLEPVRRKLYKLVTFVPPEALGAVEEALFAAGAGHLGEGRYRECAFRTPGTGSFFPEAGSRPQKGSVGRRNLVDEIRFETVCEKNVVGRVVAALHQAHPYEVPAYDLIPLELEDEKQGLGRVGELDREVTMEAFVDLVRERLGVSGLRLIGGRPQAKVKRVALCGGSGFSFYRAAVAAGADLYLTGDLKYHEAREVIDNRGIPVLDAGHFATERPVVEVCAELCRSFVEKVGLKLPVFTIDDEREPWELL